MSRKLNKLRSRFNSMVLELQHKVFMLNYSHNEYEELQAKNDALQFKLDEIARFEAYDDNQNDEIVYTLRISKIEIRNSRSANMLVDHIIGVFSEQFHKYINKNRTNP